MGKPTFGKGSVQQLFPLANGNGIKITNAYYYIKSGRCIHKLSNDKLLKGEEVSESEQEAEAEKNKKQVYYTVNKREVFGGGGITPDIETESDLLTQFGAELRRKNAFFNFTVDYMVEHDHTVEKDIKITDSLMQRFLGYAKSLDIKYTQADLDSADTYIRTMLKSECCAKHTATRKLTKSPSPWIDSYRQPSTFSTVLTPSRPCLPMWRSRAGNDRPATAALSYGK